ncbi:MAG: cyclic nucleotide-binding domain-containing protein [Lachnospiraceae bacterium]|nr:cyclic nucleotide-binding domain-containing protein [Lachnospiraceae bacterium]
MEIVKVNKGKHFLKKGDKLKGMFVILQGSVRAVAEQDEFVMNAGSMVGMLESISGSYVCDYVANTDCVFYAFPYQTTEDYKKIFAEEEKYVSVFAMGAMHQTAMLFQRYEVFYRKAQNYHQFFTKSFQSYQNFCSEYELPEKSSPKLKNFASLHLEEEIAPWAKEYYDRMSKLSLKGMDQLLARDPVIGIGQISNGVGWMEKAMRLIVLLKSYLKEQREMLLSADGDNLFRMYFELAKRAAVMGKEIAPIQQKISELMEFARGSGLFSEQLMNAGFAEYETYDFEGSKKGKSGDSEEEEPAEPYEEGIDYLTQILEYSDYEGEKAESFRKSLQEYKNLPDILATTDDVRRLRRKITDDFYSIYELVFFRSLEGGYMPTSVKMFLNFGFMDEELAGKENTRSLFEIAGRIKRCKAENVFTIYEWLLSVYKGENEPSRNEFDMDYTGYLNEQKKTGKITADQVPLLAKDNREKLKFELENMFVSTNRATYGKISTFCPILYKDDIIGTPEHMLITAQKANEALDEIRKIDFSLFFREVGFSDPEHEVNMEMIQKEVIPHIILMPNAGGKAMMWQETAGIKKDTHARFIFPILTAMDVGELMVEVCGRFRWEMCRKIQGVRWNDITEASLTSEYNDYIQYYRKNHDLSADAKEKIKNALYKSKNNYREVFVKDYQSWIRYESKGSFRLNKVARDIIFRYCPFNKTIRAELKVNPMYREMFEKYEILKDRKARHMILWYDRYQKKGGVITEDLQVNKDFYDM